MYFSHKNSRTHEFLQLNAPLNGRKGQTQKRVDFLFVMTIIVMRNEKVHDGLKRFYKEKKTLKNGIRLRARRLRRGIRRCLDIRC